MHQGKGDGVHQNAHPERHPAGYGDTEIPAAENLLRSALYQVAEECEQQEGQSAGTKYDTAEPDAAGQEIQPQHNHKQQQPNAKRVSPMVEKLRFSSFRQ